MSFCKRFLSLIACFAGLTSIALASSYTFTPIIGPTGDTVVRGINNSGQVVGSADFFGQDQGFVYSGGAFTFIGDPSPASGGTEPWGINDVGQIVGTDNNLGYFLYNGGVYSALGFWPRSINNTGQMTGWLGSDAVLYSGGSYTVIGLPSALSSSAYDVNNAGQIVGDSFFVGGIEAGFLYSGGSYIEINYPGANYTYPTGINDSGQIVGTYGYMGSSQERGFLYSGGVFTPIDDPSSTTGDTYVYGINNSGQIDGNYIDNGQLVGFLATPVPPPIPEPPTASLLGLGLVLAGWRASQKA